VHGVPPEAARGVARDLFEAVRSAGAEPALVGVYSGRARTDLGPAELGELLAAPARVAKVNTSNLGLALHRGGHGATTVSATVELAAGAGIRMVATGGIGGVHRGLARRLDVSADLAALARFPVAVVASGVKSVLDVAGTREALEALGVPVLGFGTELFPAFYLRSWSQDLRVDARFDDVADLARYLDAELGRTGRGVLVCNPVPPEHEISRAEWDGWLARAGAELRRAGVHGREVTPFVLGRLHELSAGRTLAANLALARANAALAGRLAASWA